MKHLVTLHLLTTRLLLRLTAPRRRDERGATTVEYVLWTVFAIAIIAVAAAVITGYVNDQLAKIN